MEKRIENIETIIEKNTIKFYIECECGHTGTYFAKEILNYLVKEELIKGYDIGVYQNEAHGDIDLIHKFDIGLDTEKTTIETLTFDEFVDENYDLFELFLKQK